MIGPSTVGLVLLSGFCLFAAFYQLAGYFVFKRKNASQLLFSFMAMVAALYSYPAYLILQSPDAESYGRALRVDLAVFLPLLLFFLWFSKFYTGYSKSTILVLLSAFILGLWIANYFQPNSLFASAIEDFTRSPFPWGEVVSWARPKASIWTLLFYAALFAVLFYATAGGVKRCRMEGHGRCKGFVLCMFLTWAVGVHAALSDFRILSGHHRAEIVVFVFLLYMGIDLAFEMRHQQEFNEEIFDSINDAIFVHEPATGRILQVNDAAVQMYRVERSGFLRMAMDEISFPGGEEKRKEALERIQRTVREGPQVFEWEARRGDGTAFWAEVALRAGSVGGKPRVIAVVRDITERHTSDAALRESEQRFRNVVEASPLGMHFYRLDSGGNLIFSGGNPAADKILRIDHRTLEGKTIEDAFPSLKETEVPWRYLLAAQEGVPWHTENIQYKDGRIEGAYEVYAVQTQPGAMVALFHDVTRRRQDEEDRRHMEARIQETQRLESLGILAGGIAHDFNNLLMAVRGNTETLQKGPKLDSEGTTALQGIETATQRAKDLCRQLLAYAGQGRFSIEVLDLRQVTAEIGRMVEVGMSKKAKLEYKFDEILPNVRGDATQLRQVILNLLTNASEALGAESGTVTVSLRSKTVDEGERSLEPGHYVELEVADTGCGMDAETQSRIFDPFFTTKFTGRGLGLAAVRGIVHSHRGAIRVQSSPGKGTGISVYLPVAREGEVPAPSCAPKDAPAVFEGRVLLADDDEDVRMVTRRMLERLGFTVEEAEEGRQALQMAKDSGGDLTAVVLDLTMPGLDGAEVFREIRHLHPRLPVVVVSGYSPEDVAARVRDLSAHALLQKPFNQTELVEALRKAGVG